MKKDVDAKLVIMCGSYEDVIKTVAGERAQLIVQTTETGDVMLERGRQFYKYMTGTVDHPQYVFSNNDMFFYGVRLAVKDGNIKAEDIEFLLYRKGSSRPVIIHIEQDGRFQNWPEGFFDAYDKALSAMLAD